MPKHTVILTKDELKEFNSYSVETRNRNLYITPSNWNRTTVHPMNKDFIVQSKSRKIILHTYSMKIWSKYFKNEYSVFDIENAINTLTILYQDITNENIVKILQKENLQIREE